MGALPLHLDAATVRADLTQIAAAHPDHVYVEIPTAEPGETSCMYFDPATGSPSCIIGHVLARHGVTRADLDTVQYQPSPEGMLRYDGINADATVKVLVEAGVLDVDDEAGILLSIAQVAQDAGNTWGKAVEGALRVRTSERAEA